MDRIVIAGISGFIGQILSRKFLQQGHEVIGLTRNPDRSLRDGAIASRFVGWDGLQTGAWVAELDGAAALINLSGENIAAERWSPERRSRLRSSRLETVDVFRRALTGMSNPPRCVMQASAIGYYGTDIEQELDETAPPGAGFLADLVRELEEKVSQIEVRGIRTVILRFGMVLGRDGGVLPKMSLPFRLGLGARLGNGHQWMSWIHATDLAEAVDFLMTAGHGVFNLTAPVPLRNRDFTRILARTLKRPVWFALPRFLLRAIFGKMAEEVLLSSQRVVPRRLTEAGFRFAFPTLDNALSDLYRRP